MRREAQGQRADTPARNTSRLTPYPSLVLKPAREKSLKRKHPWVFAGAIARVEGNPASGDTVELRSADGEWLAVAAYSPESQIRARVWAWNACAETRRLRQTLTCV